MSFKQLVATYGMISNYKNEKTNLWLALAEFIDNSISSWQGKDNLEKSVDGLKISLTFDERDETNRKVIITDNANGMNSDELVNSMQPSDTTGKKDTHYNQFGVGMKLAIFWQGKDGIVFSKTKNNDEYYVELRTSQHESNEAVSVESKLSPYNKVQYESGTTIIIEKIYPNKWIKDLKLITDAFGWRYRELLKNDKNSFSGMEIKINWLSSDDKKTKNDANEIVKPKFITPFLLNNFKEIFFNKKDYDKNKFLENYEKDIKELMDEFPEMNDFPKKRNILNKFCLKLLNGEPLIDKIDIEFEVENTKKTTTLTYGIIDYSVKEDAKTGGFAAYSGVTTFHLKRAINHGPNYKIDGSSGSSCIQFDENTQRNKKASGGNPTWRRLYGEIDLTGIEVPDVNKSQFNWSLNGYENLTKELKDIWDALHELLIKIVGWEYFRISSTLDKETDRNKNKIVNNFKRICNQYKIDASIQISPEDRRSKPCFTLKKENIKIWIDESNEKNIDFITVHDDYDGEYKNIYVYIDVNHIFWKPFMDDEDSKIDLRSNVTYPIVLLLVISYLYLDGNKLLSDFLNIDDDQEEPKSFYDVINSVVRALENKDEE